MGEKKNDQTLEPSRIDVAVAMKTRDFTRGESIDVEYEH